MECPDIEPRVTTRMGYIVITNEEGDEGYLIPGTCSEREAILTKVLQELKQTRVIRNVT